jgi:hypothetical protein
LYNKHAVIAQWRAQHNSVEVGVSNPLTALKLNGMITLSDFDDLNIQQSTIVSFSKEFRLIDNGKTISLSVDIKTDFKDIPVEYHEIFLTLLSSEYSENLYLVGQSTKPKKVHTTNKKWYKFWK